MTLKKQLFNWRITLPRLQEQRDEYIKQIGEIKLADFVFVEETSTVEVWPRLRARAPMLLKARLRKIMI